MATPAPALLPPAAPPSAVDADGVSFLIGRWKGLVRQKRNPFIHRQTEPPVTTESKQLSEPRRVFCRSNWGIIEDWLVVRHDLPTNQYWYEDSEGLKGVASPGGDRIVYEGNRTFDGHSLRWRLTNQARGADAFDLSMEWSENSKDWHTIYEAAFRRNP